MNRIQALTTIAMLMGSIVLKADNHSEALWLMLASRCDQIAITEFAEITVNNFAVTDEKGRNIYQIALDKHKETNSIACARMALFLEVEAQRLRNKLNEDSKVLDDVEKTFETPHN